MMPHQNKYVTSIINYVNTVNINPEEVEKLEELSNGLIFSTILK